MTKYFKSFMVIFLLFSLTAYAQEEAKEKFPKSGYIISESAEIKAGDNENFENICTLKKSDSIKIVDKRYSWYKVLLPRKAHLYISKDYVDLTSDERGIGIVNASNVNLRAGPGTRYSILGQVSQPEKLYIVSEENDWYKIEPPYGIGGWINSSQISLIEEEAVTYSRPKQENEQRSAPVSQQKESSSISSSTKIKLDNKAPMPKGNLSIN